ncbi:peptide/nickel transport system ATP-binding protein [Rhizobium sp. BK275]|uniref:ABC transporter ATP-binding protein n=1 Tax=Rhizobium sp. BK275 TaxID=2587077 RepID=UPI001622EDAE|nr:dipeptide/oligopeptide/nickel ABC transporter ATP-binding protein [Rhizobium sp. BK275]MBB3390788.1 peptide/nickel transport system ATP-binding protein [Rhizobium sp. BK275]
MNGLLTVDALSKAYYSSGRQVAALDNVSLTITAGETLGLVGASGSGKSTLSRVLLRLLKPDAGSIRFEGEDWLALRGVDLRRRRARMQMVFQDPLGAFNPLASVASVLDDPLRIHDIADRKQRPTEIAALLERVGLPTAFASRPVRTLSGGQRQRVAIARAIATRPALLVLDEAVSALDVTVRGRILELLVELQRERGLAYLFISHDLAVVRAISHRIAVMDAGRIVEEGPATDVVTAPRSDAARRLVAAVPRLVTEPA